MLDAREPLSDHRSLPRWLDRVATPSGDEGPALRLERLPVERLEDDFRRFAEELAPAATPVLTPLARRLGAAPDGVAARVLEAFLADRGLEEPAAELGCTPFQLAFFPRAFLQPVAEGLAALRHEDAPRPEGPDGGEDDGAAGITCPACGRPPVVGLLADEPEVEGRRRLVCSLCSTAWPFPRLTCPACRETEADRLGHHVADAWPHLRVEECSSCGRYLKTADLRENGNAVPVVDDLASLELDLWADDRELRKICPNVLGI